MVQSFLSILRKSRSFLIGVTLLVLVLVSSSSLAYASSLGMQQTVRIQQGHMQTHLVPPAPRPAIPQSCTYNLVRDNSGTDSSGVYGVNAYLYFVTGCGSNYYLGEGLAYVQQGYSFNIRLCVGQAPESNHGHEVCHDYSGTAPLHGWYSPLVDSFPWTGNSWCESYSDIIGHVGVVSGFGC